MLNLDLLGTVDPVRIYCATHEGSSIILQELEGLGITWNSGPNPTEIDYWEDSLIDPGITYIVSWATGRLSKALGCHEDAFSFEQAMSSSDEFEVSDDKELLRFLTMAKDEV